MDIKNSEIFKKRELSELISDSINFYMQEAKPLLKLVFSYIWPYLIFKTIFAHYYGSYLMFEASYYSNIFQLISQGPSKLLGFILILKLIDATLFILIITLVGLYIKTLASKGFVEKKDIGPELKKKFFKILASNYVILFILLFSFLLILPGIYLFVVFSIVPFILIFENISIEKAIRKSIQMIKGKWWNSFGAFLVVLLIYFIFTLIVSFIIRKLFVLLIFFPLVYSFSSLLIDFLYAFAVVFPIILAGMLYTSLIVSNNAQEIKQKQKTLVEEDTSSELKDKDKQKNRFLDNNEDDKFKRKH